MAVAAEKGTRGEGACPRHAVQDPFGHTWSIATHVEDVSPEEMQKRAAKHGG